MSSDSPRSLVSTALLLEHPQRGWLRVCGSDRVRFLHAMLSNDIEKLPELHSVRALLLDRKGHVQSMLTVLCEVDALWLDTSPETGASVRESLEKFVIADDVVVEDQSSAWRSFSIEGADALAKLRQQGLPALAPGVCERDASGWLWCGGGMLDQTGARCWVPRADAAKFRERLDLEEPGASQREALFVAAGVPRYGVDVTPKNFPHEARLEREFVSFKKGCYIGQEIVARIHSRGAVNRLLVQLALDAEVAPGDVVAGSGRERLGQVTSVAQLAGLPSGIDVSSVGAPVVALAYVSKEHAVPGEPVSVGEVRGRILGLANGC